MSDAAAQAVDAVRGLLRHHDATPLLLAVDGCDASTRSPVVDGLEATMAAGAVVRLDDFVRPMDDARRASLDPQTAYELHYDWQRLIAEVLDPLVVGDAAAYRRFDGAAGRLGDDVVVVEPHGTVVVEGPFVLRPQLAGYWDIAVHVAGGPADGASRWYLENVRPAEVANVVVPASGPVSR